MAGQNTYLESDGKSVAVTHLTFTLDTGRLATANVGISKGSGELWIDTTTKYIVRMKMTFTSSVTAARGEATTTITLSKFNDPGNAANCPS